MPAALSSIALALLLPSVPVPPRLTADVDDALSLRLNPAGLGLVQGSDVRVVYGRYLLDASRDADAINGISAYGAWRLAGGLTLGGSYGVDFVPDADDEERGALGLGLGGRSAAVGVAWEHLSPSGGSSRSSWSLGLTLRPTSWLSAAIAVLDVGEQVGPRLYDLGLALRPGTDRVLLSTRWRLVQGVDVFGETQDLAARVELEPLAGIFVGAGANLLLGPDDPELGVVGTFRLGFDGFSAGAAYQDTVRATEVTGELAFRRPRPPSVLGRRRVAVLDLEGDLVPDPSFSLLRGGFEVAPYGAVPLLLDELSRLDRALGVYLRIASLSIGWARAEELRAGILAIRAAGKRVDCELGASSDLEYFVATACSNILLSPAMTLDVNGVAANVLFFGGALERLGVDVDVVQRGRYKSTPEALSRTSMSEAQREALGAYLDQVYGSLVRGIESGRRLEASAVEAVLARGSVTATEAVSLGLADKVLYPDEVDPYIDTLYGFHVGYADAEELAATERTRWGSLPRIAVIHVDAAITSGQSRSVPVLGQTSGAETLIGALELARLDSGIRAVVLRVDSPGGDALASDLIARAVGLLEKAKPVIVSFGDTAASGGYYISAPARAIYAQPTTLTGSIGVFSFDVSIERLLSKLDIHADTIERGPLSNADSIYVEPRPEAHQVLERQIDFAYRMFLDTVAKGRRRRTEEIREIAEGRIWSGADARTRGLVDELGGIVDALRRAKKEAGLPADESVELVTLPLGRVSLPISVATSAEELASAAVARLVGPPAGAEGLARLVPEDLGRALAPVMLPSMARSGQAPLAVIPFALRFE